MRLRLVLPTLAVALAASAAWGPPAVAAPGEGGGAQAGSAPTQSGTPSDSGGDSGGAAYGEAAPKPKAKRRRHAKPTSAATAPHRFPVAGAFDWGGPDARFGAKRKGHRHQGQDLTAASGTPVVAPYRGVVVAVQYQPRGAGRYVVIDGEDYDYVFMHLRTGSVVVHEGERVRTGQQIGQVGSTGESTGPHLHFELWLGAWFAGGHAIDPLPLLQQWAASPTSG
jgi:murein DD-endopeptidase MepM/ murein hydrolase activator NlpD